MTASGFMKPKLGAFSIESLVGGHSSPSLSDLGRDGNSNSPAGDDPVVGRPPSPLSLGPLFPRGFLSLQQEKNPPIQRPQPINGATHRVSADPSSLPGVLQAAKGLQGAFGASPLIPQPLGLASFPQLQGIPLPPQLSPLMMGGGVPGLGSPFHREYSLYPWLMSRHGRIFPQGLPSPEHLAYLLQPFRKPKRIRTAFSPSQLLKLEQAFERNQYVVGTERKQLAQNLNLSETQVKVWFQNRRTKEKRIQQEDDGDGGGRPPASGVGGVTEGSDKIHEEDLEDEDLDEDLDDEEETVDVLMKRETSEQLLLPRRDINDVTKRSDSNSDVMNDSDVKRIKYDVNDVITTISTPALFLTPPSPSSLSGGATVVTAPHGHTTASTAFTASTASSLSRISLENVILPSVILGQTGTNNFDTLFETKNGHPSCLRTTNSDVEIIK